MITVHCSDGEGYLFEGASRYVTDEHNNLEVMAAQSPVGCFTAGFWLRVEVGEL